MFHDLLVSRRFKLLGAPLAVLLAMIGLYGQWLVWRNGEWAWLNAVPMVCSILAAVIGVTVFVGTIRSR